MDYCHLNNPFSNKEEEDDINAADTEAVNAAETEAMLSGDNPKSLDEAKKTSEWLEWEQAIKTELDQLKRTKTWMLVKRPVDAIPITNKWVFTKKYSKSGKLLKYKARLVAKGCAQRPGYNYLETFSPVVLQFRTRSLLYLPISDIIISYPCWLIFLLYDIISTSLRCHSHSRLTNL